MRKIAGTLAVAASVGAVFLIVGASTDPGEASLAEPVATAEIKPLDSAELRSVSYEAPVDPECRTATWPHLPKSCMSEARKVRVIR